MTPAIKCTEKKLTGLNVVGFMQLARHVRCTARNPNTPPMEEHPFVNGASANYPAGPN